MARVVRAKKDALAKAAAKRERVGSTRYFNYMEGVVHSNCSQGRFAGYGIPVKAG